MWLPETSTRHLPWPRPDRRRGSGRGTSSCPHSDFGAFSCGPRFHRMASFFVASPHRVPGLPLVPQEHWWVTVTMGTERLPTGEHGASRGLTLPGRGRGYAGRGKLVVGMW